MNPIPDMEKPSGQSEAYDLTYFDGHKRRVYVTDDQFYLTNTMMIFSRTDTKGFITSVNLPFIEASGWEKEDLIGQPHYILRHPHMPASAFEDLWSTLQAGKQWTGCVKNLRKDGGYYWVRAVVDPIIEDGKIVGYNSVRQTAFARLNSALRGGFFVRHFSRGQAANGIMSPFFSTRSVYESAR